MPLTLTPRLATIDDADVCIRAAAEAGNPTWDKTTVESYLADDNCRIVLVVANWPERSISNRPVAMVHGMARGNTLWVQHLAVDSSLIPENFTTERRRAVDRALARLLQIAAARGLTIGKARRIKRLSRIAQYIDSISGVTKIANQISDDDDYEMNLSDAITFLQSRSPS